MTSKLVQKRRTEAAEEAYRKKLRRRRRRVLTVAGAILVLFTFVVREAFREQLKGMSDAIAAAQNVETEAQARQIISEKQSQLDLLQRRIADKLARPNEADATSRYDLQMEIAALQQHFAEASESVEHLSDLLDRLPKRGEGAKQLRHMRDDTKKLLNDLTPKIQKAIKDNSVPHPTHANHVDILTWIIIVEAVNIEIAVWSIEELETATKVKQADDTLYGYCTWMSYFLYFIGGITILAGQLYGIE